MRRRGEREGGERRRVDEENVEEGEKHNKQEGR